MLNLPGNYYSFHPGSSLFQYVCYNQRFNLYQAIMPVLQTKTYTMFCWQSFLQGINKKPSESLFMQKQLCLFFGYIFYISIGG